MRSFWRLKTPSTEKYFSSLNRIWWWSSFFNSLRTQYINETANDLANRRALWRTFETNLFLNLCINVFVRTVYVLAGGDLKSICPVDLYNCRHRLTVRWLTRFRSCLEICSDDSPLSISCIATFRTSLDFIFLLTDLYTSHAQVFINGEIEILMGI